MKILALFFGIFISASSFAGGLPTKNVSLEVKQAGVRDVLENMLAESGLKYEIAPSVSNNKKISIDAKEVIWSQVFKNIIDQSNLQYSFDKSGKLHITKM